MMNYDRLSYSKNIRQYSTTNKQFPYLFMLSICYFCTLIKIKCIKEYD